MYLVSAKEVSLKNFALVEFKGESTVEGLKPVDCVPSSWIRYDNDLCSCVVHFMGPPYTKENNKLLYDLIKLQAEAPDDWPWYPVELKGHAKTYAEGTQKINLLKKKSYVYTTDSKTHGKEKADRIVEYYKKKNKPRSKTVDEILSEAKLTEREISSSDQSQSEETTSSDDEDTAKRIKTNKKKRVSPKKSASQTASKAPGAERSDTGTSSAKKSTSAKNEPTKSQANVNLTKQISASQRILRTIKQQAITANPLPDVNVPEFEKDAENVVETPAAVEESITEFPRDFALIYKAIKRLMVKVDVLGEVVQTLQNSVERALKNSSNPMSIGHFLEKYNSKKLSTFEELEAFNLRLVNEAEYAKDLKAAMESLLNSELKQTITGIIKRLFARELAMKCTAFRKSNDKYLLHSSSFYNLLFNFVSSFHNGVAAGAVTEKQFYHTLSACLTNSKDWDGHRKLRGAQA